MARHYHAPAWGAGLKTIEAADVVYRRKSDADACLADTLARADRPDTPFTLEQLAELKVRSCSDPTCIGEDG